MDMTVLPDMNLRKINKGDAFWFSIFRVNATNVTFTLFKVSSNFEILENIIPSTSSI